MVPAPIPPSFPPPEMIYDEIMGAIDPRLKTTEIGILKQRYADLQPEDREKMLREFAHAFVAFETKYEQYHDAFHEQVQAYKEQVTEWATDLHNKKDKEIMAVLDRFFLAPPAQQHTQPVPPAAPSA